MVSLCFRSLAGYINDDNLQGLQSFLENKQIQVDDRDEVSTVSSNPHVLFYQNVIRLEWDDASHGGGGQRQN